MIEAITKVNQQGRIVIPIQLRQQLELVPGSKLIARLEGNRIILEKPDDVFQRLRSTFNSPESLVEELIAERRIEATHE
ncbi:MAG: AbrB/MazE/SpoVT family DNA-binding domain-containing protein [Acaryochloris sp. RU_4_1]|nr:AbrB/MazE/SpoVT family DNA-binding domain-containing protein [Acaryochloris sp. SU_5_25]NJM67269.1 AbrB/MazE/SpoVT family DNA-binding domain-containing protein [Acaryochloris sp. RU_4_1]NJN37650.1 AbrB/MazE/SpoVT family DNA-binding domain-containing protein [Acaryochloridaceae cyanobacterium CSU_3_4]NJR56209.1 AbrB/MazE/SpoVT family DNA-binding domain-containing protein [Acaryochloris sp. CRU_2_0]